MQRIAIFTSILMLFVQSSCKEGKTTSDGISEPVQKPNIVFVLADDMGIGDLGSYGQEYIQTPNLDRMAEQGMLFTNFYSGSTVCAPSRASLMTGMHTGHLTIRGNGEFPLKPSDTTIAQILKSQGYHTAMFGKWGLGLEGTSGSPEKKGWDEFTGHLHHVDAHFQNPDSLWSIKGGEVQKSAIESEVYANEIFNQKGIEFIDRQSSDHPFFLFMSYTVPHAELRVPDEFLELYLDQHGNSIFTPEKAWPQGRHYGGQEYPKAAYAAMVSSVDAYLGRLLEKLKDKGLEQNTLVIFTSDNGTHIEGGRTMEDVAFFNSTAGLRGVKRDLYEGGIRTPLIAYWPGTIAKGSTSPIKAAYWDLLPTFADFAGYQKPLASDGISIANTLLSKPQDLDREFLYWEFHEAGGKIAIRMGDWKVVWTHLLDEKTPVKCAVFNLKTDPSESNDVASQHPDIIEKAYAIYNQQHQRAEIKKFEISIPEDK
jgi:arylsulfatase A-like enzyme